MGCPFASLALYKREDGGAIFAQRYNVAMCEKCGGFAPIGPSASREDRNNWEARQRNADSALAELTDARTKLAEHKREHGA